MLPLQRKTSTPRSRGKIICDACYATVPPGITYRRDVWRDGTHHFSIRYCPECWLILDEVEEATQPEYGGPDANQYEQWAADNIHEHRAQAWALRAFPE